MEISSRKEGASIFIIENAKALDPIRVIIQNERPGVGRIIIQCYKNAWTGYWGAMGSRTVEQFFAACDASYLVGNLLGQFKVKKADEAYLLRIVEAVCQAMKGIKA
jgi:hypothetical protein